MPIHELMVMYGYSKNTPPETNIRKKKKKKKKSSSKKSKDKKRKKKLSTSSDGVAEKKSKSTDKQSLVEENAGDSSNKIAEETTKENGGVKDAKQSDDASKLLDLYMAELEVKTRSVAELVHFYYFWKKSDRHDQFERKQVSMRPEMKQWQHWESEEDQDSDFDSSIFPDNSHDDSEDSLNAAENKAQMKCLIYADRKRQIEN
ncbi:PREDICTED: uncharacterized protein LOC107164507 [Diuraphis noxia]|uniref:uncharacterized protein LOC107164507 n=1 Tax=Diuraphis noxia TaxID=143948 RepID=UPI0007637B4F|nr:PREDICTED: uncharacterized protein LOC107164507 [Diuraphis noxia]